MTKTTQARYTLEFKQEAVRARRLKEPPRPGTGWVTSEFVVRERQRWVDFCRSTSACG